MPPTPHDAARLYDMVQAAEVIARYLQGRRRDDLDHDAMLRDALECRYWDLRRGGPGPFHSAAARHAGDSLAENNRLS